MLNSKVPSPLSLKRALNTLLEGFFWLPSLATNVAYSRVHDDCDGDPSEILEIAVAVDGDVHILLPQGVSLRFRTWAGGGLSLRTRNALLVLAEAIRRDNEVAPLALQMKANKAGEETPKFETPLMKAIENIQLKIDEVEEQSKQVDPFMQRRNDAFIDGLKFALKALEIKQTLGATELE